MSLSANQETEETKNDNSQGEYVIRNSHQQGIQLQLRTTQSQMCSHKTGDNHSIVRQKVCFHCKTASSFSKIVKESLRPIS